MTISAELNLVFVFICHTNTPSDCIVDCSSLHYSVGCVTDLELRQGLERSRVETGSVSDTNTVTETTTMTEARTGVEAGTSNCPSSSPEPGLGRSPGPDSPPHPSSSIRPSPSPSPRSSPRASPGPSALIPAWTTLARLRDQLPSLPLDALPTTLWMCHR